MKHKLSNRRRRAGALTLILAVAILVTGTLAWQAISQRAVNNVAGEILPAGARLHDDFGLADEPDFTQPLNKDVYVENYSGQNPQNTDDQGETVFVRVKLMEYMEMGVGAGLFGLSGSDPSDYQTLDQVDAGGTRVEDSANDATSLVAGASILDISTWRPHVEDDLTNPFAAYWGWAMGGTKAFMPTFNKDSNSLLTDRTENAHDKYNVGDKENGTAHYANPAYDNNPEEHTSKDTLATAGIVSMAEWMDDLNHPIEDEDGKGYWVGDTDGWYYWSKGLEPGEATALLLDQFTLTGTLEGEFYYGIHVISEMATAYDWGDADDETGFYEDGLTEDGEFLLNQAAGSKKKLLYVPMDDTGTAIPETMLLYNPMDGVGTTSTVPDFIDSVNDTAFSILAGNITKSTTEYKMGSTSAYFPGTNLNRINATTPNLNFGVNDFTISFWVKPDTQTSSVPIIFSTDSNGQGNNLRFFLRYQDGKSQIWSGTTQLLITSSVYKPDTWTHYAVVRKEGVFTVYENGVNVGSTSSHKTTNINLTNLSIGGNNTASLVAYKGYLDDFAIYDHAKYDSDFTPPATPDTDAKLLYLDFENDENYNQEPLKEALSGSYFTNVANADILGKDDQYKFGGSSLYFPGTTYNRINMTTPNLNLGIEDFTISYWLNPEENSSKVIFSTDNNGQSGNLRLFIAYNGNANEIRLYSGSTCILNMPANYLPGVWTHYAVVRKDGIFTVYQNGVAIGSTSSYKTTNINLTNLSIGGNSTNTTAYKGYIDDFAIYRYAKYDGAFTPPTVDAMSDPTNQTSDNLIVKDTVSNNNFNFLGGTNIQGSDIEKKFGSGSLYFPGVIGGRANLTTPNLDFGVNDFTISFWLNPDTNNNTIIFSTDNNDQVDNLRLFIAYSDANNIRLYSYTTNFLSMNANYLPGAWSHYAVVRKDGVFTVYQNGICIGSTSAYKERKINLTNVSLGGNSHVARSVAYKGYMDDFTIYNYAVWNGDFTPPTTAGTP